MRKRQQKKNKKAPAKKIARLLGRRNSRKARSTIRVYGNIVFMKLAERKLELYRGKIYCGKIKTVTSYGCFDIDSANLAADFLLNPSNPPFHILKCVDNVTSRLIENGISGDCISVEWPGCDCPEIRQSGQPGRLIRIGHCGTGTIAAFDSDNDGGTLCDEEGAINYLQGLWVNDNDSNVYEKQSDGNYKKIASEWDDPE
jgi:hypothetical protein